jgi:hypothetical protein
MDIAAINARSTFVSTLIDVRRDRDVDHSLMMHPAADSRRADRTRVAIDLGTRPAPATISAIDSPRLSLYFGL